ncbi:MAG: right-handed parallel beta-helix repeat-containing protein [Planctomycetes bacterium]|nr:right-handed parallel beta-helix repeat-containing protein [Planctomycetota bacterium]MCC7171837.1 right-handed parallel beta-helix repeat-containing protein [Planctomycetota bacterium]
MKLALAVATTLFPFAMLHAGTIRVPADQPSIDAALKSASAGDTIEVAAGLYREAVVIDASLDGVTLRGKGKVIIEPRDPQLGALGPGIQIAAANVTVRNLIVRHAKGGSEAGIEIQGANSVALEKVTVVHANGHGIVGSGKLLRIENCTVQGCNGGIELMSDGAIVRKTKVEQDGQNGIIVIGDSAIIEKCKVRMIEGGSGISVAGSLGRVESNDVSLIDTFGIWVDGAVSTVRGNKVRSLPDDGVGILVQHAQLGTVLEKNTITETSSSAILIAAGCSEVLVRKNVAKSCGVEDEPSFLVDAGFTTLEGNMAQRGQCDGFRVTTNFNELIGNVAKFCLEDGFDIDGGANVLTKNVSIGNGGEGIENSNALNSYYGNTSSKNRIDIAASAVFANFDGNVFKTGGANTLPEIDD